MTRSRVPAIVATLALAAAACGGDGTAPRETVVAVNLVQLLGPTVTPDPDGESSISCEVELSATGAGQGAATWVDGTFRIFATSNPSTPAVTTPIALEVLRNAWGAEQIAAGETQTSRWRATTSFAFSATMDFRYRPSPGGSVLGSGISFTCSP